MFGETTNSMKVCGTLWAFLMLVSTCMCFSCSDDRFKPYNFESIKGVHSASIVKKTPPSETNTTWYFGICENVDLIPDCPRGSDLCAITHVKLKDQKVITEKIGLNDFSKFVATDKGVTLEYPSTEWGDTKVHAKVDFECSKNEDASKDTYEIVSWADGKLHAKVSTKASCITSDKDKKKTKKPDDDDKGESWGWFTWIFIFMVLFLSIYIVGGAWFQYNKGNSIDFQSALKEVLENFVDLLKGLPSFIREIIVKFTGNNDRGEYSAV